MLFGTKINLSFSTTLSILINNRNQFKIIPKKTTSLVPTINLLPYFDMSYEYFQSTHLKYTTNFP
jgi:hypothetical protein